MNAHVAIDDADRCPLPLAEDRATYEEYASRPIRSQ